MARQLQQRLGLVHGHAFEHHGLEQARHLRLLEPQWRIVVIAPLHVRAVPAVLRVDGKAVEFADRFVGLRRGKQLDRLGDRQFVRREVVGNARGVLAALDVRAVLARLHHDQLAVGVGAERERVDLGGVDLVEVLLHQTLQAAQRVLAETGLGGDRLGAAVASVAEVEAFEPLLLGPTAVRDLVEVVVDRGGEVVVDQRVEVFFEQSDHGEGGPGRHERLTPLPHVPAVLDGLDDRRPRGGTTDAQLFEPLHERCLGVAGGRRRAVAVRFDRRDRYLIALGQRRKQRFALGLVVAGLLFGDDVHGAVSGKRDRGARRRELAVGEFTGVAIGGVRSQTHADGDTGGIGHLRRERSLPDHAVQGEFLAVEFRPQALRRAERCGRADRLMRFLSVLDLRRELLGRRVEVVGAVLAGDRGASGLHRLVGQHDVVGTHVGDEAALVQALGDAHHLRRRQAQLAAALLLQRGGHERRLRRRAVRLLLHRAHRERGAVEAVGQRTCPCFVERDGLGRHLTLRVEVLACGDPVAVDRHELGVERRFGGGTEIDVPVVGGDVRDAFAFALHDQTHRRALHTAGREPTVDAAPQHGRDLVAVETVEDSPRLGGIDEAVVEAARVVDRVVDCGLGDLVEHHPLHRHLRLQVFEEVPRDGFALTVFIGCEIELRCVLQRRLEIFDDGLAALGEFVGGLEAVVDVDVQTLARQVGDVAHRGAHVVIVAEELRQRLRLGGRLDDDERFGHQCLSMWCCGQGPQR